jgi:hypothetical protein
MGACTRSCAPAVMAPGAQESNVRGVRRKRNVARAHRGPRSAADVACGCTAPYRPLPRCRAGCAPTPSCSGHMSCVEVDGLTDGFDLLAAALGQVEQRSQLLAERLAAAEAHCAERDAL